MIKLQYIITSIFSSRIRIRNIFRKQKTKKVLFSKDDIEIVLEKEFIFLCSKGVRERIAKAVSQVYFTKLNLSANKVAISFFSTKHQHIFCVWDIESASFEVYEYNQRVKSMQWLNDDTFIRGVNYLDSTAGFFFLAVEQCNTVSGVVKVLYEEKSDISLSLTQLVLNSDRSECLIVYSSPFWVSRSISLEIVSGATSSKNTFKTGSRRFIFDENNLVNVSVQIDGFSIEKVNQDPIFVKFYLKTSEAYIKDLRVVNGYILILLGCVWNDTIVLIDSNKDYSVVTSHTSSDVGYIENLRFHKTGFSFSERSLLFFVKYSFEINGSLIVVEKKSFNFPVSVDFALSEDRQYYVFGKDVKNFTNRNCLVGVYGNSRINDSSLIYSATARDFIETGGLYIFAKTKGDTQVPSMDFNDNDQVGFYSESVMELITFLKKLKPQVRTIGLIGVSQGGLTVLDVLMGAGNVLNYAISVAPYLGNYVENISDVKRIVTTGHSLEVLAQPQVKIVTTPMLSMAAYHDDRCLVGDFKLYLKRVGMYFEKHSLFVDFDSNHNNILNRKSTKKTIKNFITKEI